MVAAAETAPIERIPLQKDEGGPKTTEGPNECTATPPLHSRTIAPPLHGPHSHPAVAHPSKKSKGAAKSCSPQFAIICGRSDLCRAYARVCPSGQLPYRYAQKP